MHYVTFCYRARACLFTFIIRKPLGIEIFLVLHIYDEGLISNSWALRGFYYREVVTVIENCLSFFTRFLS